MNKYAIDRLDIEIGRWCNMTCKHCYKGERERLSIDEKYIDKLLDEIYLVNHVYFCGGEAMFYMDKIISILEIFKRKKVPVNFIRVNTNIKEKNEKFVEILNQIPDYAVYPDESKIIISSDEFHIEDIREHGEEEYYEENKKWYRERLNKKIKFSENDGSNFSIYLNGRAKTLSQEYLEFFTTVIQSQSKDKGKIIEINTLEDNKSGKIKRCINGWVEISSEGYIFTIGDLSYDEQRENDYFLSLGNICDKTLKKMIKEWNNECSKHDEVPNVVNRGYFNEVMHKALRYIDRVEYVFNDDKELDRLKQELERDFEEYKKYLDKYIEVFGNRSNDIILVSCIALSNINQTIESLKEIPKGFWRKIGVKVFLSSIKNRIKMS